MNKLKYKQAEDLVAQRLEQEAWTILARNFRRVGTELDIVATKGRTLVFVEVKLRTQPMNCLVTDLLPIHKKKALLRGAFFFLSTVQTPHWEQLRIDLSLVSKDRERGWQHSYYPNAVPIET